MTHKLKDVKDLSNKKKTKKGMVNITINIPDIYIKNLKKLIENKIIPSRSEGVRIALREFFQTEYENLKLLDFFDNEKSEIIDTGRKLSNKDKTTIKDLQNKLKSKDHMIDYLKQELEKHEKGEMNGNTK